MDTGSNDVEVICQRMALIRREHHAGVRDSVAGAEALVDWGRYTCHARGQGPRREAGAGEAQHLRERIGLARGACTPA